MAQLCKRSHRGCTINKPALLRQTFELSVAYSGKILSLTKMLGTLQDAGDTVTLAGYLNLLGDSGLVTGLQKFSMDMARKRASIPKYQVYNNALLSVQMGLSYREALADNKQWGADIRVGYRSTYREPSFHTSLRSILLARRQRRGGLHPQEESEDHSRGGEEQCGEPHHWLGAFPPPLQSPSHHHRGREGHQARGIPQHGLTETV